MSNNYPEFDPKNRRCVPGCPACLVAPHVTGHDECFTDSIESFLGLPEPEKEPDEGLCLLANAGIEVYLGDKCTFTDQEFDAAFPPK